MHSFAVLSSDGGLPPLARSDPVTLFVANDVIDTKRPIVTSPANGASVQGNTFTITGTSEPGVMITLSNLLGSALATAIADGAGTWAAQVTESDGSHFIIAIAEGDDSVPRHSDPLLIHTNADGVPNPGQLLTPTVTSPTDGALITNNNVTISGTSTPNATITMFGLNGVVLGIVDADDAGEWSTVIRLENGLHVLTVTSTVGDSTSGHSPLIAMYVDDGATLSNRPAITSPDAYTVHDSRFVEISGTAVAGSTIEVFNYGSMIATAMAGDGGAWSVTVNLPNGMYAISAVASTDGTKRSGHSAPFFIFVEELIDEQRKKICR